MLAVFDTAKTHASDSAVNCQSTDVNKQQTCFKKKKKKDLPFQICKIDSLIVYSSAYDLVHFNNRSPDIVIPICR